MNRPSWMSPMMAQLARQSLVENSWDLSLILADAIEEAGGPRKLVKHLRDSGQHTPKECGWLICIQDERDCLAWY